MSRLVLAASLTVAAGLSAADPQPFANITGWGEPEYSQSNWRFAAEEYWRYTRQGATLTLRKQACDPCTPLTQAHVQPGDNPGDSPGVLVSHSKGAGILSFTKSDTGYHITAFELPTASASYRLELVVSDEMPAAQSFELQRELIRTVHRLK